MTSGRATLVALHATAAAEHPCWHRRQDREHAVAKHLRVPGQIDALYTCGSVLRRRGARLAAPHGSIMRRAGWREAMVGSCTRSALSETHSGRASRLLQMFDATTERQCMDEGAPKESAKASPLHSSPEASRVCETLSRATAFAVGSVQLCAHGSARWVSEFQCLQGRTVQCQLRLLSNLLLANCATGLNGSYGCAQSTHESRINICEQLSRSAQVGVRAVHLTNMHE